MTNMVSDNVDLRSDFTRIKFPGKLDRFMENSSKQNLWISFRFFKLETYAIPGKLIQSRAWNTPISGKWMDEYSSDMVWLETRKNDTSENSSNYFSKISVFWVHQWSRLIFWKFIDTTFLNWLGWNFQKSAWVILKNSIIANYNRPLDEFSKNVWIWQKNWILLVCMNFHGWTFQKFMLREIANKSRVTQKYFVWIQKSQNQIDPTTQHSSSRDYHHGNR